MTACPYIKDKTRWHVDILYTDPRTSKEVRIRRVAPKDLTHEKAIRWGELERLRLVTDLARSAASPDEKKEGDPKAKSHAEHAPTLAELWLLFCERYVAKQKAATRLNYKLNWEKHIAGILGNVPATSLDLTALSKLRDKLEQDGLQISSQKKVIQKVQRCLTWAMRRGKLPFAEVPTLEWDKVRKKRVEIYSPAQLERQLEVAEDLFDRGFFCSFKMLACGSERPPASCGRTLTSRPEPWRSSATFSEGRSRTARRARKGPCHSRHACARRSPS
ncbi:hypothetical protein SAMN02745121_05186 [Nannocystis exedens]|uniref:Core-binding (CB) domain-containing protein n=1 Tax=Nannocystis exedens TaxID=54 RepID=A0A1I2CKI5_9BACT|nr:hypothetical protein NAEX_01255 [Nannocystis exedens]SFE68662.1 hypothetical protein SAMN02745121_05186 [Nannocystis exedens]